MLDKWTNEWLTSEWKMNEESMNERMSEWWVIHNPILIAAQAIGRWNGQQRHSEAPPKWYKAQIQYIQPAEGRKRCAMQLAHGLRQSHSQAATNILRYGLLYKYSSFPDQTIWGRLLWGIVPNPTVILHIVTTCLGESRKVWLGCVHVWVQCEGREWAITHRKCKWWANTVILFLLDAVWVAATVLRPGTWSWIQRVCTNPWLG